MVDESLAALVRMLSGRYALSYLSTGSHNDCISVHAVDVMSSMSSMSSLPFRACIPCMLYVQFPIVGQSCADAPRPCDCIPHPAVPLLPGASPDLMLYRYPLVSFRLFSSASLTLPGTRTIRLCASQTFHVVLVISFLIGRCGGCNITDSVLLHADSPPLLDHECLVSLRLEHARLTMAAVFGSRSVNLPGVPKGLRTSPRRRIHDSCQRVHL